MSSIFGQIFTLTSFGESHGIGLGGVIDGCPSGIVIDEEFIAHEMAQRSPGNALAKCAGTKRKEADTVEIYSGLYEGKTTGTPLAFFIKNTNQKSHDYSSIALSYRPGHADRGYDCKYGLRDPRGGGRSSGRETASRVAGGAIAQLFLKTLGIKVYAYTLAIDGIYAADYGSIDYKNASSRSFAAPNEDVISSWEERIQEVRKDQDTLGGLVQIIVKNVPAGLGEPVFHKLDAVLASALMGVGAVKAVEVGDGFLCATSRGSFFNDAMYYDEKGEVCYKSNHAGGIVGGISTGQDIILTVAVKPIPSIGKSQETINTEGENIHINIGGRHDICAIPRVVPVLRAMTALTLADMFLLQRRMQGEKSQNSPFCGENNEY